MLWVHAWARLSTASGYSFDVWLAVKGSYHLSCFGIVDLTSHMNRRDLSMTNEEAVPVYDKTSPVVQHRRWAKLGGNHREGRRVMSGLGLIRGARDLEHDFSWDKLGDSSSLHSEVNLPSSENMALHPSGWVQEAGGCSIPTSKTFPESWILNPGCHSKHC